MEKFPKEIKLKTNYIFHRTYVSSLCMSVYVSCVCVQLPVCICAICILCHHSSISCVAFWDCQLALTRPLLCLLVHCKLHRLSGMFYLLTSLPLPLLLLSLCYLPCLVDLTTNWLLGLSRPVGCPPSVCLKVIKLIISCRK